MGADGGDGGRGAAQSDAGAATALGKGITAGVVEGQRMEAGGRTVESDCLIAGGIAKGGAVHTGEAGIQTRCRMDTGGLGVRPTGSGIPGTSGCAAPSHEAGVHRTGQAKRLGADASDAVAAGAGAVGVESDDGRAALAADGRDVDVGQQACAVRRLSRQLAERATDHDVAGGRSDGGAEFFTESIIGSGVGHTQRRPAAGRPQMEVAQIQRGGERVSRRQAEERQIHGTGTCAGIHHLFMQGRAERVGDGGECAAEAAGEGDQAVCPGSSRPLAVSPGVITEGERPACESEIAGDPSAVGDTGGCGYIGGAELRGIAASECQAGAEAESADGIGAR